LCFVFGATGPILTFIPDAFAAAQPHQTGHSFMAQHFQAVEVVSARQAADRASVACLRFSVKKYAGRIEHEANRGYTVVVDTSPNQTWAMIFEPD